MVDPGRKHLENIIQMNLLQQQQLIDRPYTTKSLLHFQQQETKTTNDATRTTITTSAMPVTTSSSSSPNGLKTSTTLEQLQMQYQHIMTQMQMGLSSNLPPTTHSNYSVPEKVRFNKFS